MNGPLELYGYTRQLGNMVILMILEGEFPPDLRVENEISALIGAGHNVHLLCSTRKKDQADGSVKGAYIHRFPISNFIYKSSIGCLRFPFYFNFWRNRISRLLKRYTYDMIHIHDLPLCRLGIEIKRKYKIPVILDLHENWPGLLKHALHTQTFMGRLLFSYAQWSEYEKEMAEQADAVITVIEEARDRVASLGINKGKISIVSNTVNVENIPSLQRERRDNDFILFYAGGVNRHRGLQIVMDSLKILESRNIGIRLQIAGSGSYLETLMEKSTKLGIGHLVVFHGQIPFKKMMELLAKADAAIIPHLRNDNNDATIPHKLFQYMYLNIPVISSDCPPLKRIVEETDTGFIYKNDSPDDLALLLEQLHSNRDMLNNKGINGHKAVMERYNWNYDRERLIEIYKNLEKKTSLT